VQSSFTFIFSSISFLVENCREFRAKGERTLTDIKRTLKRFLITYVRSVHLEITEIANDKRNSRLIYANYAKDQS